MGNERGISWAAAVMSADPPPPSMLLIFNCYYFSAIFFKFLFFPEKFNFFSVFVQYIHIHMDIILLFETFSNSISYTYIHIIYNLLNYFMSLVLIMYFCVLTIALYFIRLTLYYAHNILNFCYLLL